MCPEEISTTKSSKPFLFFHNNTTTTIHATATLARHNSSMTSHPFFVSSYTLLRFDRILVTSNNAQSRKFSSKMMYTPFVANSGFSSMSSSTITRWYSLQHAPSSTIELCNQQQYKQLQKQQQQHQQLHPCRTLGTWAKIRPKRIRVITMDITGTLVSFRGSLKEHYVGTATKCGIDLPEDFPIKEAFAQAYKECSNTYPCFGSTELSAKEWWKKCVLQSFDLAGANLTEAQQEIVFQRIYSRFGSQACYEMFHDAIPFLRWLERRNVVCGVLSNADERYGDSILPMLGITHDELQFQLFSKDVGYEKPDGRFYIEAMRRAEAELVSLHLLKSSTMDKEQYMKDDPLYPSQILHVGNDYNKDFEGARRAGWHAVLLNRYNEEELASEWKRRGAIVLTDLLDLCEFLGSSNCQLG